MAGWVIVTGKPLAICHIKVSTNDPRLPNTLPNRTEATRVPCPACRLTITSANRFDIPNTDVGLAALSVEMFTNRLTPWATQTSATL